MINNANPNFVNPPGPASFNNATDAGPFFGSPVRMPQISQPQCPFLQSNGSNPGFFSMSSNNSSISSSISPCSSMFHTYPPNENNNNRLNGGHFNGPNVRQNDDIPNITYNGSIPLTEHNHIQRDRQFWSMNSGAIKEDFSTTPGPTMPNGYRTLNNGQMNGNYSNTFNGLNGGVGSCQNEHNTKQDHVPLVPHTITRNNSNLHQRTNQYSKPLSTSQLHTHQYANNLNQHNGSGYRDVNDASNRFNAFNQYNGGNNGYLNEYNNIPNVSVSGNGINAPMPPNGVPNGNHTSGGRKYWGNGHDNNHRQQLPQRQPPMPPQHPSQHLPQYPAERPPQRPPQHQQQRRGRRSNNLVRGVFDHQNENPTPITNNHWNSNMNNMSNVQNGSRADTEQKDMDRYHNGNMNINNNNNNNRVHPGCQGNPRFPGNNFDHRQRPSFQRNHYVPRNQGRERNNNRNYVSRRNQGPQNNSGRNHNHPSRGNGQNRMERNNRFSNSNRNGTNNNNGNRFGTNDRRGSRGSGNRTSRFGPAGNTVMDRPDSPIPMDLAPLSLPRSARVDNLRSLVPASNGSDSEVDGSNINGFNADFVPPRNGPPVSRSAQFARSSGMSSQSRSASRRNSRSRRSRATNNRIREMSLSPAAASPSVPSGPRPASPPLRPSRIDVNAASISDLSGNGNGSQSPHSSASDVNRLSVSTPVSVQQFLMLPNSQMLRELQNIISVNDLPMMAIPTSSMSTMVSRRESARNARINTVASRLPCRNITKKQAESGTKCMICYEKYEENDVVKTLPCIHYFHERCIGEWFSRNHDTCPECRFSIMGNAERDLLDDPADDSPLHRAMLTIAQNAHSVNSGSVDFDQISDDSTIEW